MRMNALIPMMGQAPDVVGSLQRGNALAEQENGIRRQNALDTLYRDQGAGILAGDQNALNALAGIDPVAALGVEQTRHGMQVQREQLEIARRNATLEAQKYAQGLTAAQAKAEAEKLSSAVQGAMMAPDEASYNAFLTQHGVDPQQYPYAQRDMWAGMFMGMTDALKARAEMNPDISYIATGDRAATLGLDPNGQYNVTQGRGGFKATKIGGGDTNVTVNAGGDDKFAEAFGKADADAVASISESGMAALRNMPRIEQLSALLDASPSGADAAIRQFAGEWGINTEGLDTLQAAQALINSMVPEQRQPGSGPMSDADLALFKQALPRLINQPGGNKIIVDAMRAIATYDAEGAAIVQKLRSGEMTRAQAFDALQKRVNPLAEFRAPGEAPKSGGTRMKYNPQSGQLEPVQ